MCAANLKDCPTRTSPSGSSLTNLQRIRRSATHPTAAQKEGQPVPEPRKTVPPCPEPADPLQCKTYHHTHTRGAISATAASIVRQNSAGSKRGRGHKRAAPKAARDTLKQEQMVGGAEANLEPSGRKPQSSRRHHKPHHSDSEPTIETSWKTSLATSNRARHRRSNQSSVHRER